MRLSLLPDQIAGRRRFPHLGYDPALRWLVALAAVEVLLVAALRLPALVFQVDQRQWHVESVSVARQLLWLALLSLLLLRPGTGLADVVVARLFCAGFEAAALLALARRHVGLEWGLSRSEAAAMLGRSWPVALSSLAVFVYHRIDQVMLGLMVPMAEIGRYVAAVNISEQFSVLALAFVNPLTPLVARAAGDPQAFARYQRLSFRYLMTLAVEISVAAAPSAGALLQLLFGGEFRAAHGLLAVLIWSEVAVFFGLACNLFLIASHRERVLPVGTLVGALANFGLNLALIPRLGAEGAALATAGSFVTLAVLAWWRSQSIFPVGYEWARVLRPLLVGGMLYGVSELLPLEVGVASAVVRLALVASFPLILWLTGYLSHTERKALDDFRAIWRTSGASEVEESEKT